jgi:hypothetical protein
MKFFIKVFVQFLSNYIAKQNSFPIVEYEEPVQQFLVLPLQFGSLALLKVQLTF